jgi:hypothetical protein
MKNRWIGLLMMGWLVVGLTGCATSSLFKWSKHDFPKAGPNKPVAQILGIWEPAMGIGLENKTSRGFAGQILFFCKGSDVPVQVDGDVRIYVFDDQGTADEQAKSIYEMNFTGSAWNQLLTKGTLGATYNVFTPYIREGHHEAKCTLRVRYVPAGGSPIYSDMVNICLEGKKKPAGAETPAADYDAAAAGPRHGAKSADSPRGGVASRQPPQARGMGETIAMPDERTALRARRQPVAELTEEERARIIRDARARLKAETKGRVELVSHEESASEGIPAARRSASQPSWNALKEEADRAEDDASDAGESPSSEESVRPAPRRRAIRREHVLDGDKAVLNLDEQEATDDSVTVRHSSGHVLDD